MRCLHHELIPCPVHLVAVVLVLVGAISLQEKPKAPSFQIGKG